MAEVENEGGYGAFAGIGLSALAFYQVDGKVLNQVTRMTVPEGMRFVPFFVVVVGQELAGVGGSADTPKISIGTNSPDYNNVFQNTQLTGLLLTDDAYLVQLSKNSVMPVSGQQLVCKVNQSPNNPTAYKFHVYLVGTQG